MIYRALTLIVGFIVTSAVVIPAGRVTLAQSAKSVIDDPLPTTEAQAEAALPKLLEEEAVTINGDTLRARAQQVIRVLIEASQPEKAARAVIKLADCCRLAGNYFDAVGFYRQALEIQSLSSTTTENILTGIAQTYADLSAFDLAERYFLQALEQTHDQLETQSTALVRLADLYQRKGALDKASEYIAKAMQAENLHRASPDPVLLLVQGLVSQERQQNENARTFLEEALALFTTNGDFFNIARTLCALSSLSLATAQPLTAMEQAKQASDLGERVLVRSPLIERDVLEGCEIKWRALLAQARAERALGYEANALNSYKSSLTYVLGGWPIIMATEESAIAYRQQTKAAFLEYADLLIENGECQKAYEIARQAKAQTFLYFSGAKPKRRADDPSRNAEIREQLRGAASLRSRLASRLSKRAQVKAQGELLESEFRIEALRLHGEMAHRRDRMGGTAQYAKTNELVQKVTADHIALVDFSLTENHSLVSLLWEGKEYYESLPSRMEIENAVRPFLDDLSTAPNPLNQQKAIRRLQAKAQSLFTMLFGGLASRITPGQRLVVVPDGLLNYLPFETLMDNGRYLIEDHEISYIESANLLVQRQSLYSQAEESGSKMDLLAFGDPVFGAEPRARIKQKHRTTAIDVLRRALTSRGFQLPPIPRTRDEVESIAGFFPGDRTRLYLGRDSTKNALHHEALRRYRRLHFATHSFVDEKYPKRSAVLLTANSEDDGLLDVNEISELDLDCDLVVLSACQTGRGQLLTGEGIIGLARAFQYAGARSVIVSLWSVSDISTSHLMKDFYRHVADNMRNTEALRLAKLRMLRSGNETRHPYFWAPFVSVGKP